MSMNEMSEAVNNDNEYFEKAVKRVVTMTRRALSEHDIIIELEKEIDCYREKIKRLEDTIEDTIDKVRAVPNAARMAAGLEPITQLEGVQENMAAEIIKALADNGYNTITINCYKDNESEV